MRPVIFSSKIKLLLAIAGISGILTGATTTMAASPAPLKAGSRLSLRFSYLIQAGYPEIPISQAASSDSNEAICVFRAAQVRDSDRKLSPDTVFTVAHIFRHDLGTPDATVPNQELEIAVTDSRNQMDGSFWCHQRAQDPLGTALGSIFPTDESLSKVFYF